MEICHLPDPEGAPPGNGRTYTSERPDSSDAVRGLAALALEQQDYAEAYDLHRRLIEMGERGAELFYNAGLICQKRGEASDAVTFYQQIGAERKAARRTGCTTRSRVFRRLRQRSGVCCAGSK